MLIRARHILPITAPPIEDGAVWISGDRVRWVGRHREAPTEAGPVTDLGKVILLPGLVNAHAHLDYTHMVGQLAPPKSFPDWIKAILSAKNQWGFSEFAASWLEGARQCLRHGITTVANMESVPDLLSDVRSATPLRVHSFLEVTGVRSRRPPSDIIHDALSCIRDLPPAPGGVGLSPHAPYSTSPELLQLAGDWMRQEGGRLSIHLAESKAEFEMYLHRRGPMFDWLSSQRTMDDCGQGSPVRALESTGALGPNLLAVHVNYLWLDDARILGHRGVHVVHCPQSHAYFHHQRFPRGELMEAGVNVCLGTDSLASTRTVGKKMPRLSLWDELAALRRVDSGIEPATQLALITSHGARALGLAGRIGLISPGSLADLCVLPHPGGRASPIEAAAHHLGEVEATMIGGRWIPLTNETGSDAVQRQL